MPEKGSGPTSGAAAPLLASSFNNFLISMFGADFYKSRARQFTTYSEGLPGYSIDTYARNALGNNEAVPGVDPSFKLTDSILVLYASSNSRTELTE